MKHPPPAGSVWSRIEKAREALEWNESKLGTRALKNRTGYTKIAEHGWNTTRATEEKVISCLEREGYSGVWLRAGVPPERANGEALPESPKIVARLRDLARKLGLPGEQLLELWAEPEGPLERFSDECQRAAFAAAYLDGRTLEDVKLAIERAKGRDGWRGATNVDQILLRIRMELTMIKPASGTMGRLAMLPRSEG